MLDKVERKAEEFEALWSIYKPTVSRKSREVCYRFFERGFNLSEELKLEEKEKEVLDE